MPSKKSKAVRLSHFIIGALNRRRKHPNETLDSVIRRILHLPDAKGAVPPTPRRLYAAQYSYIIGLGPTAEEARGDLIIKAVKAGVRIVPRKIQMTNFIEEA